MIYLKALNTQSQWQPFHIIIMADSMALRNRDEGIWITRTCSYLTISNAAVLLPSTWKMGRFGGRTFSFRCRELLGHGKNSWSPPPEVQNQEQMDRNSSHTHTHTHTLHVTSQLIYFRFATFQNISCIEKIYFNVHEFFPVHRIHWHN